MWNVAAGCVAEVVRAQRAAILSSWVERVRQDPELVQLREANEPALLARSATLLDALIAIMAGADAGSKALEACRSFSGDASSATMLRELMHLCEAALAFCSDERLILAWERVEPTHALLERSIWTISAQVDHAQQVEREEELRLSLESARCGTWKLIPRTGELSWDAGCKRLFGVKPGQPVDYATFLTSVHPDDRQRVEALVERALDPASGGEYWAEYRAARDSNPEVWVEARGRVFFDAAGAPERFLGVMIDVTARKQRELAFSETARLCEQLMGIVGHDLRNPLTTVVCAAGLLLQRTDLAGDAMTSARRIAQSAGRMARLVHDLLDLTHCRTRGSLPIEPKPMDLGALCRAMIEELEQTHPGRAIRLQVRGRAAGVWDPDRLAQVLSNLLGNALSHGPEGAPVGIGVRGRRGFVILTVHNEGPPIPPEVRASLLDPCWPSTPRAARGRGSSGLGLGLFISQHIVRAHGGTISLVSEEGRGTTVDVSLPRAQAA